MTLVFFFLSFLRTWSTPWTCRWTSLRVRWSLCRSTDQKKERRQRGQFILISGSSALCRFPPWTHGIKHGETSWLTGGSDSWFVEPMYRQDLYSEAPPPNRYFTDYGSKRWSGDASSMLFILCSQKLSQNIWFAPWWLAVAHVSMLANGPNF